ncbi:hypothetical membrane protein [Thermococcus kodakarensis KOD1]|uniref:Hypothetical membrane protein n=1 Tax=Thermococcus kodakarensis (strain ATCC BAA-918 / JCM 12380 / KOD1) TaxID=69014 RepID=Q5JE83_THEKO|nr:hypothetical protein [Thermococcus kodakarensis]WCN29082.1 hypothetical protein POG15_05735 [Thermococcus kodakarensis]WCN31386.1 hypothetical protein POG21_05735 [Thermococcus kodakarensis]BAD85321.1 hypothetical membrane protein [Thermococcus kodakarensis KOD1]
MKPRSLLYLFLFPAWEFLLMILLPSEYYVGASCLQIRPHPICAFHFSPSATFVLLVTAPFLISIILGLWKEWGELVAFGIPSLAVVLVTLLLLDLFEKSWIPPAGAGITSAVLYSVPGMGIRLNYSTKRVERLVWATTSFIVSFIICVMVWGGTSVAV